MSYAVAEPPAEKKNVTEEIKVWNFFKLVDRLKISFNGSMNFKQETFLNDSH